VEAAGDSGIEIVQKKSTATAMSWLAENEALKAGNPGRFRVVTDFHRDDEGDDAAASLIKSMRSNGWNTPILIYCGEKVNVQDIQSSYSNILTSTSDTLLNFYFDSMKDVAIPVESDDANAEAPVKKGRQHGAKQSATKAKVKSDEEDNEAEESKEKKEPAVATTTTTTTTTTTEEKAPSTPPVEEEEEVKEKPKAKSTGVGKKSASKISPPSKEPEPPAQPSPAKGTLLILDHVIKLTRYALASAAPAKPSAVKKSSSKPNTIGSDEEEISDKEEKKAKPPPPPRAKVPVGTTPFPSSY